MTATLLVRTCSLVCALPMRHVIEILRPLPVEAVRGAPDFVRGMALVRGAPAPVIDASHLLTGLNGQNVKRYVSLQVEDGRVMLAVDAVLGVHELDTSKLEGLPSLLANLHVKAVESMGAYGRQILFLLDAARLVSPDIAHQASLRNAPQ